MAKKVFLGIFGACAITVLVFLIVPAPAPVLALRFWGGKFTRDGKALVTVGGQTRPGEHPYLGEFILWDMAGGTKKGVFQQRWGIRGVDVSPDGTFVALGDFGGVTRLVDPVTGKTLASFLHRLSAVNAVAISGDNKLVVSGCQDGKISVWDLEARRQRMLSFPQESMVSVAISPGGRMAAASRSGKVFLIDLQRNLSPTGLLAYGDPPAPRGAAEAVAFAPDGLALATGCQAALKLWETKTGTLIRDFKVRNANTNNVAASDDGAAPVKAETNATRFTSIAFPGGGGALATADWNGMLTLWNVETGERLKTVQAHAGPCFSLCFSPDFKRIATVGRNDFRVRIWDAQTLELITSFNRSGQSR